MELVAGGLGGGVVVGSDLTSVVSGVVSGLELTGGAGLVDPELPDELAPLPGSVGDVPASGKGGIVVVGVAGSTGCVVTGGLTDGLPLVEDPGLSNDMVPKAAPPTPITRTAPMIAGRHRFGWAVVVGPAVSVLRRLVDELKGVVSSMALVDGVVRT